MSEQWFNADGLKVDFGRENVIQDAQVTSVKRFGSETELRIDYDLTKWADGSVTFTTDRNNDGTVDGFNIGDAFIPEGAYVESVAVYPTDTAAGGTSMAIGAYTLSGTAIDSDGYFTPTNGAVADLVPDKILGSGALLGAATTADHYLAIAVEGTFTKGSGYVLVRYTT